MVCLPERRHDPDKSPLLSAKSNPILDVWEHLTSSRVEYNQALDDLAHISRQFVEDIVRSVPREWDVSQDARKALTELITQRALYLAQNRTGIMSLLLYQGQLNLPAEGEDEP